MIYAQKAILDIVDQINHLLDQIDVQDYRRPLPEFDGSTLGQHFRHILEFFQCLSQGWDSGMVDYASRERNLLYEENPQLTASAFEEFTTVMRQVSDELPVAVRAEFGGCERPEYRSTFGRELAFVYDHAIHHLAIIRIGINCQCAYVNFDKNLGVSPSTIKSRQMTS